MGVDVSRLGDDRTVILIRNGDQLSQENISIHRELDVMQVASMVDRKVREYKGLIDRVFIDGIGIGAGVVDRLLQLGYEDKIRDVNVSRKAMDPTYYSLKDECWDRMRTWIKNRGNLPEMEELADDLTAPRYDFTRGSNLLKIEAKADMKKRGLPSCDIADALALTFSEHVALEDAILHQKKSGHHPPMQVPITDPFGSWENESGYLH